MVAKGTCYQDVWNELFKGNTTLPDITKMDKVEIVHGSVRGKEKARITHAWIEFTTGKYAFVWEPENKKVYAKSEFYDRHAATKDYDLTPQQYMKLSIKYKNYGPFSPKELITVKR